MKIQWILAALLVAVVVFIATYLKMFTDTPVTPPPPEKGAKPEVTLFFPKTVADSAENNSEGADWESGMPGHYDFWFQNPNDETVTVGLNRVGCAHCTKVEFALESNDWKTYQLASSVAGVYGAFPGTLDWVPAAVGVRGWHVAEPARGWKVLEEKPGFEVPAGASGWIRVDWDNTKKVGKDTFTAAIWTSAAQSHSPLIQLHVPVMLVPAVGLKQREFDVGAIGGDKPHSDLQTCVALTSTRKAFKLEVAKENDPFVDFGKPVPLTPEQCHKASEGFNSRIKAGYLVPFSVRERLEDGRQLDLGPFHLKAFLKPDVSEDLVGISITGIVKGDVSVVSANGRDRISMGVFDATLGESTDATLESRNLDLELAVDTAPGFLKVELSKEPRVLAGIKSWNITVKVPSRAAAGEFPRDDNQAYRDSAIYLKILDPKTPNENARRIRIPVSGKASSK
jgi:hypothetical protein